MKYEITHTKRANGAFSINLSRRLSDGGLERIVAAIHTHNGVEEEFLEVGKYDSQDHQIYFCPPEFNKPGSVLSLRQVNTSDFAHLAPYFKVVMDFLSAFQDKKLNFFNNSLSSIATPTPGQVLVMENLFTKLGFASPSSEVSINPTPSY